MPMCFRRSSRVAIREFLLDEEKKTSNQIVVLTVNSLDGEDYRGLFDQGRRSMALGQEGKDNGVLVVAAIKDRKMRIEVGKGLEGVLTDALASQIIHNEIAPKFKQGDYGGGLWAGVNAIDKAIRGEYKADQRTAANAGNGVAVHDRRHRVSGALRADDPAQTTPTPAFLGGTAGGSSLGRLFQLGRIFRRLSGGGGGYSGGGGDFCGGGGHQRRLVAANRSSR